MINGLTVRRETREDFHAAELATLMAFWNLHHPGCDEHYLVHKLREHACFVPELAHVAELDGEIIGAIYYARAKVGANEVLTFGPLCVKPRWHRRGVGGALLTATLDIARRMDLPGIVIYGEPDYYPRFGFKTTDNYKITGRDGGYSPALMGYEFAPGSLLAIPGAFEEPEPYMNLPKAEVDEYGKLFPHMPKLRLPGQWND